MDFLQLLDKLSTYYNLYLNEDVIKANDELVIIINHLLELLVQSWKEELSYESY